MKSRFYCLILTLACCLMAALGPAHADGLFSSSSGAAFARDEAAEFLPVDQAFHAYAWHDDKRVYVGIRSRPGYYLYRHRFALESDRQGLTLGTLEIPPGKFKHDPYLGDVHVFHDQVEISAALPGDAGRDARAAIPLTLSFQGCADAGLCYPPEHWQLVAKAGPPPAAYADASNDAKASPIARPATSDPFAVASEPFSASGEDTPLANPIGDAPASDTPASDTSSPAASSSASPIASPTATAPGETDGSTPGPSPGFASASVDSQFQSLLRAGIGITTLGLFFLAGLGLTFTPCVLPMLPILTSIIVGQNAHRGRALALSLSYVAGMALTFTLLGTLMGLFGASLNLQARLQSAWVLVPFAALFALFAVAMFGGFDLRLPSQLSQRANRWQERLQRSGPLGLAGAGALSVLVVSPCVSAPLAGALVFISTTGDTLAGALALLALGLGMGVPLIVVGTFGGQWLPRAGAWMNGVKAVFGVMLLGVAIWLIERLLPGPITLLLWATLALGCALRLGLGLGSGTPRLLGSPRDPAPHRAIPLGWPLLRHTVGWVLLVWGVAMVWGAAQGGSDPLRPLPGVVAGRTPAMQPTFETVTDLAQLKAALSAASASGQPAMVDVSADWCISCKVMEREVFPRPAVSQRLADFRLIRADVTEDAPASRQLLEHFGLFGPPGLLFFADGRELERARIQGEVDAPALEGHLDAVKRLTREQPLASASSRS